MLDTDTKRRIDTARIILLLDKSLARQSDTIAFFKVEIEAEQSLVAASRELITRFEQKIQATLARIWGEAAPAAPET